MKCTDKIIGSLGICCVLLLSSCATIVNDANIPLAFSFSDGSAGNCTFKNKRGVWESHIPTTGVYIRRSDDALIYECKTKDGREATGSVRSEMEGGKLAASIIFWDLGITDAITDKHRTYQGNVVIPVPPKDEAISVAHASGDTKESPIEENQVSKPMSAESAFHPGDMALLEFKDGSSKVITISDINEKSISGYYDYKEGAYQISDNWKRDSITSMKHVKVTPRENISELTQSTETVGVDNEISSKTEVPDNSFNSDPRDIFSGAICGCGNVIHYKKEDELKTITCPQCGRLVILR